MEKIKIANVNDKLDLLVSNNLINACTMKIRVKEEEMSPRKKRIALRIVFQFKKLFNRELDQIIDIYILYTLKFI